MQLSFDEFHRARVLDAQKYKDSEALQQECAQFMQKVSHFEKLSTNLLTVMEAKSKLIEEEKLKAIGKRIQVERQAELRKRKQKELQALVTEKQQELERYIVEYESLLKLEQDQKVLLDKLSNNEV